MTTARATYNGAGTQSSAITGGGYTTDRSAATEEWTGAVLATRTITTS
jgi:hypothetical protein